MWIILGTALGAYTLVLVAVAVFQRQLIYLPTRLSPGMADAIARKQDCIAVLNSSGKIIGWQFTSTNSARATVLVFHGNAGCALDRMYLAEPIAAATRFRVIVAEYPGYGAHPGQPDLPGILAAAEELINAIPGEESVYLVSESLGAGAAAHVARRFPDRVHGLALIAPYDDLGEVAQDAFPWLPARWLLRDRFRPALWLSEGRAPALILIAGADEVIPAARGENLHASYPGPKRIEVVTNAHHNDIAGQSLEWWHTVFTFFAAAGTQK